MLSGLSDASRQHRENDCEAIGGMGG